MALKTAEEHLQEVETALSALRSGVQSFTISGVAYSKADIAKLQQQWEYFNALNNARTTTTKPVLQSVNFGGLGYS